MLLTKMRVFKRVSFILICLLLIAYNINAQSDDDCLMCHDDPELTTVRQGKTVSMYVNTKILSRSVHRKVKCASCHEDAATDDFLHSDQSSPVKLSHVKCGKCHGSAQRYFDAGIHGQALRLKEEHAPDCKECHGRHEILSPINPKSRTYKMNIPVLCGNCHKEGAPVARAYNITEHNIVENYSQGIHGKGLFESGLIVTATCNDCHGNHLILPHTSLNSSISPRRIAKTCMKCHARIEEVHKKFINQELWEKKPGAIPACSDCHPPHKVDIQNVLVNMSDRACLKCHENDDVHKIINNEKVSLKIDKSEFSRSVHKNITCVKCHTSVTKNLERPCETIKRVDCSNCHADVASRYFESGHGQAFFRKDKNAPYCTDCHGTHVTISRYDDTGPTYRTAIPELCGNCHRKNGKASKSADLKEITAYSDYSSSVHGKGVYKKGLLVSAVCTDCHTTHFMLKETDERASIHPKNIPSTCAKCHKGIYDVYIKSDHSILNDQGKRKFPTCADCHSAHVISEIDKDKFMTEVTHQCGSCHEELAETYLETYHGKAYQLGYFKAARCSDCHGAHNIYNVNNVNSLVGPRKIVETCQKCHAKANMEFTRYLSHATHNNRDKYPALYYTFWGMTFLLIGVFGFFGIHILIWLPRSLKERRKKKHRKIEGEAEYVRRFTKSQRITHIFVILSFVLLALTGMMLKFAHMAWAQHLAEIIGGVHVAGNIHRFAAVITFGYFAFHLYSLFRLKIKRRVSFGKFFFGSNSLMFNKQDIKDFVATIKWFFGLGPRPAYGRWTYWEKFDYMAVFWGVAIIGASGLVLWFPELFTKFFPGWFINVCQIIHSDEALLAVGFIFTVHFFNTHFRPEAFPMDTVIFTGHIPLEEFKHDRPREYDELVKSGNLKNVLVKTQFSTLRMRVFKTFGFFFLTLGIILVILILYSLLIG